jgi:hypothetical protein
MRRPERHLCVALCTAYGSARDDPERAGEEEAAPQAPLSVKGAFHSPDLLALANAGGEALEAILHPFDRALQQQRRRRHGRHGYGRAKLNDT